MAKPDLPRGYLGPQPKCSEFRLMAVSHRNPEVTTNSNKVEIKFEMGVPVKVTGNLLQTSTNKDVSEHIFTQTQGNVVCFVVNMPETGYYKLQIYALPVKDDSKTLPGVYNYLINCTDINQAVAPFPKQYAQWKEGCYLYEPFCIHNCNDSVEFKVYIPKAQRVAVCVNDAWTHLTNAGNDVWFATAKICENARVTLNANYGGEETKYSTLLEYKL